MAMALDMQSADFERRFAALVAAKRESSADVDEAAARIVADVQGRAAAIWPWRNIRCASIAWISSALGSRFPRKRSTTPLAACPRAALDALRFAP